MGNNETPKRPTSQQIASRKKAAQKQKLAIIIGCTVLAIMVIGLIVGLIIYSGRTKDDGKILPNVYAAGIDLGGMTKEEASNALQLVVNESLTAKNMIVRLPDDTLTLRPADTKLSLDVDAVVQTAYSYGRGGSDNDFAQAKKKAQNTSRTIALLPYMELDLAYIRSAVNEFCSSYGTSLTQPSAALSGERPKYDSNYPNMPVKHQQLVITMGTPDYLLRPSDMYNAVLDAYSINQMTVNYQAPSLTEPRTPDAAALFEEFCTLPTDAYLEPRTYEPVPETVGYGFDISTVQKMIDSASYGETITVELKFLMPEITAWELTHDLFTDRLSEHTCSWTTNGSESWAHNLKHACNILDEYVIEPDSIFSFNTVLGRLTKENGFEKAPAIRNGIETEVYGGGVSQVASALYYCALTADLPIMERHNSPFAVEYAQLGLDAWVDGGSFDLRFQNNTDAPIRIIAFSQGSSVSIQLLGTSKTSYSVKVETTVLAQNDPQTVYRVVDKDNIMGYHAGQILQTSIVGYEVQTSITKGGVTTLVDVSNYAKRDEVIIAIEKIPDPLDPDFPWPPDIPTDPTDPVEPVDPPVIEVP